jgi:hypothetical protein
MQRTADGDQNSGHHHVLNATGEESGREGQVEVAAGFGGLQKWGLNESSEWRHKSTILTQRQLRYEHQTWSSFGMTELTSESLAGSLMSASQPQHVDILVLGAGWLYQFLQPLFKTSTISHAATTTTGRDGTLPLKFDPSHIDRAQFDALPTARVVLITFPVQGSQALTLLLDLYASSRPSTPTSPFFILLGSSGSYSGPGWHDRHSSPSQPPSARWEAEDELLREGGCVLNLSGLMGEPIRDGRIWDRAILALKTDEEIWAKGSVHFVSGTDVARAIVACFRAATGHDKEVEKAKGQRWLLTDLRVYDWWTLIWDNAQALDSMDGHKPRSFRDIISRGMQRDGTRALSRNGEALGWRMLDAREFWQTFGLMPQGDAFSTKCFEREEWQCQGCRHS